MVARDPEQTSPCCLGTNAGSCQGRGAQRAMDEGAQRRELRVAGCTSAHGAPLGSLRRSCLPGSPSLCPASSLSSSFPPTSLPLGCGGGEDPPQVGLRSPRPAAALRD